MSLIISDLHGNYAKCKTFIEYKHEEEHIILGDFMDSFTASDADIIATFKLAVENGSVLLCGNHELPYLNNAHGYFRCSGNRYSPELFHVVNLYKELLHVLWYAIITFSPTAACLKNTGNRSRPLKKRANG